MTPHTTLFFSTEQLTTLSMTPPRPKESAVVADSHTPDCADKGVDAEPVSNANSKAAFPGSSRVNKTSLIKTTFLVNEELVPIKIENIPGHYTLFNLVLII